MPLSDETIDALHGAGFTGWEFDSDELIAQIQARFGWKHWVCLVLDVIAKMAPPHPDLANAAAAYYIALAGADGTPDPAKEQR